MRALWKDEEATATVEYALLLTLIVIAVVGGYGALGEAVRDSVANSVDTISNGTE